MLNKHQYKINLLVLLLISQQNETCIRRAIKHTATMVAVLNFKYKPNKSEFHTKSVPSQIHRSQTQTK